MTHDPLHRGLLPYEARALAWSALVVACGYVALLALAGFGYAAFSAFGPDTSDPHTFGSGTADSADETSQWWLPPAFALAIAVMAFAVYRAVPALRHTARTGEGAREASKRFGVAWLAALPCGFLLGVYPAVGQILYTILVLPAVPVLLVLSRVVVALRR